MDKIVITEELLERINAKARLAKQEDDEEWIVQGIETSLAAVTSGEKCKAYFADDDTAEYIAAICPDVVLALISELRKRAKMNWILAKKLATSEYSCVDPVQLSVELSAARRAVEAEMDAEHGNEA